MYKAIICKIKVSPISGADKIQLANCAGYYNEAVANPDNKNDLAIHGFDEDGNVFAFLSDELSFIVRQKECHASSLAAEIYYAYMFSCSKGCSPACYYWR